MKATHYVSVALCGAEARYMITSVTADRLAQMRDRHATGAIDIDEMLDHPQSSAGSSGRTRTTSVTVSDIIEILPL
jgi:hypothetical protein